MGGRMLNINKSWDDGNINKPVDENQTLAPRSYYERTLFHAEQART